MAQSVIIVGAGIAGLSAGCYARMNGYRATIFEMHHIPGGLCTAWTRKGYTWDISMHLLTGSKAGPLHQMWRELGAVQQLAQLGSRLGDLHGHDRVARFYTRERVAYRTYPADARGNGGHLVVRSAFGELLEPTNLSDVELRVLYLAGVVQMDADLCVTFDPRNVVDRDGSHPNFTFPFSSGVRPSRRSETA
jgi:2-polyprenyl-6-methoxyphenol hydroxylase-like FAD-dependent oxidoreductase